MPQQLLQLVKCTCSEIRTTQTHPLFTLLIIGPPSGNGKKKVLLAVVLVAIAGVVAFIFVPKKSALGDAVKTAGLNVTSSGKLKLFDSQSKVLFGFWLEEFAVPLMLLFIIGSDVICPWLPSLCPSLTITFPTFTSIH